MKEKGVHFFNFTMNIPGGTALSREFLKKTNEEIIYK